MTSNTGWFASGRPGCMPRPGSPRASRAPSWRAYPQGRLPCHQARRQRVRDFTENTIPTEYQEDLQLCGNHFDGTSRIAGEVLKTDVILTEHTPPCTFEPMRRNSFDSFCSSRCRLQQNVFRDLPQTTRRRSFTISSIGISTTSGPEPTGQLSFIVWRSVHPRCNIMQPRHL